MTSLTHSCKKKTWSSLHPTKSSIKSLPMSIVWEWQKKGARVHLFFKSQKSCRQAFMQKSTKATRLVKLKWRRRRGWEWWWIKFKRWRISKCRNIPSSQDCRARTWALWVWVQNSHYRECGWDGEDGKEKEQIKISSSLRHLQAQEKWWKLKSQEKFQELHHPSPSEIITTSHMSYGTR